MTRVVTNLQRVEHVGLHEELGDAQPVRRLLDALADERVRLPNERRHTV